MATITGKSVVITGGSRGIGHGLVKKFLERSNKVIATARVPQDAQQLQQLAASNSNLTVAALDISNPQSIMDFAAEVKKHTSHVDVLINNAGIYGRRGGLMDLEAADFQEVFNTNTVGPFLVVQQVVKQGLLGPPGSTVVNISSIMSSHADPTISSVTPGGYAYRASKAALNIINKALVMDLSEQKVDCVLMHPGYVKTDMTGGAGYVEVEESVSGIMKVLEDGRPLNGRFWSFSGDEIPW